MNCKFRIIPKNINCSTGIIPFGHIVKKDGDRITVACSKDYLRQLPGYRFWQKDKNIADIDRHVTHHYHYPKQRMHIIEKMLAEAGEDVLRTFTIDRSVRVMKNGKLQPMSENLNALTVGNKVAVEYQYFYEERKEPTIWPEYIWTATNLKHTKNMKGN